MITRTSFSLEQELFLRRLARLARMAAPCWSGLPVAPEDQWREVFLHKALLSTYLDCRALGVSIEAHNILHAS